MSLTPWQERLIDCVVDIAAGEPDGDHVTSHWLFVRKVLRESKQDAYQIAVGFRDVKLTREKCLAVADGWEDA